MRYLIIGILIMIPIISFGQSEADILKIAKYQTVRIVIVSYNKQKQISKEFGIGIVLKGMYLATCYHLISPEDTSYKLSKVYLVYNEQMKNGKFSYDSILLNKDFKPNKNQYDFSKHNFSLKNRSTDFVVLKLSKKLKEINYNFSTTPPKFTDITYSYGNVEKNNTINPAFQKGFLIVNYNQDNELEPVFYGCLVPYTKGFSGSPLYNQKGEISGMVQFSMEEFPDSYLLNLVLQNKMTMGLYNEIALKYKEGFKLQFSIDFNYLKSKYLKGYL